MADGLRCTETAAPITAPFSVRMVWDEFVIDPIDPTDFSGDEIVARVRVRAHWEITPLGVDNEDMSAATELKEHPRGTGGPVSTG